MSFKGVWIFFNSSEFMYDLFGILDFYPDTDPTIREGIKTGKF
ncbi:hypothetical protein LEP1GSC185_0429 [Leptospira licerasiae serovar Varillal str. VAR 010]|nr:hypothetical protein LEP1GSC185_0429 [Leptospira licerasiae serovar Varillal str. VAR 010]